MSQRRWVGQPALFNWLLVILILSQTYPESTKFKYFPLYIQSVISKQRSAMGTFSTSNIFIEFHVAEIKPLKILLWKLCTKYVLLQPKNAVD